MMTTGAARRARVVLASCVSGLLLGAAARVAMRVVALEAGVTPGASLGGTMEVVVFGALVGTPAALAFLLWRGRSGDAPAWMGVACGLSLLAVLLVVQPPAAGSALASTPDTPAATLAAFGVMFAAWGLMLAVLSRWLCRGRGWPRRKR